MKNRILFIGIVVVFLFSCAKKERISSEIEMLSNHKISFVDGFVELQCNSNVQLDSLLNKDIKIISYISNISCSACGVKTLKIMQREMKNIDDRIAYIIVLYSDNQSFL